MKPPLDRNRLSPHIYIKTLASLLKLFDFHHMLSLLIWVVLCYNIVIDYDYDVCFTQVLRVFFMKFF